MTSIAAEIEEALRHADQAVQALKLLRSMLTRRAGLDERLGPLARRKIEQAESLIQHLILDLDAAHRDEMAGMFDDA